jgi:hypothetical protein
MTRLRFTLAQLMAAVVFIGLGFAALRSASLLWASAVFTLTVAVLSMAVLGAMARRGRARMPWVGFALFGWIYLGTAFGPWADANGVGAPPYVTRWVLDYWDAAKRGPVSRMDLLPGEVLFSPFPPVLNPRHFLRVGHCLAALLFGLVGAVSGRLLAVKDERPNP